MTISRKRVLLILGIGTPLIVLGCLAAWLLLFVSGGKPSNIVDFNPVVFQARATSRFFYSIGDDLKNADEIDLRATTLVHGRIGNFLVSPDSNLIAVVANRQLIIAHADGSLIRDVVPVDTIYHEPKPIGKQFFRDDDFQWTRDSRNLYLIKDEFYDSKGSQLYSDKGELWKYDIATGSLELVLKPFPAYSYFFGQSGIYFSVPTPEGDLHLQYFDGRQVRDVGEIHPSGIPVGELQSTFTEMPFYSFSISDNESNLSARGVKLSADEQSGLASLRVNSRTYVTISRGENFKGTYYCPDLLRRSFLPGDRFFLFNLPYCGNFNGQLLIDTQNGRYSRLPADTRVYTTLDTDTWIGFRITSGGVLFH